MTQLRLFVIVALGATMAVSACARTTASLSLSEARPVVADAPPPPAPAPEAVPAPAAALTEDELFARKTLEELNAERPLGDVFFDLDQSRVRDDARDVLQKNAAWLQRWPSTRIIIEGHADERSTSEYNLALGEQRASAVQAYLVSLGVSRERVVIVSKGEESPFCRDAHEGCWQQNRRGHFIITAK